MLLSTVNPEAAAAIGNIRKVGVGNVVVYHGRPGYVRERRAAFPAFVFRQHPEDGSLDLLVFMEREDFVVEERVQFQSHNQPHHCWSAVTDAPGAVPFLVAEGLDDADFDAMARADGLSWRPGPFGLDDVKALLEPLISRIAALEAPQRLAAADLTARLEALEAKRGPGRPAKAQAG